MENIKIIRAFGILNRTFLSYITRCLSDKDITYSDSVFLVNIGLGEGITQEGIANTLAIDKAAIARSVKNLEKKEYIRTEQSKVDKRAKKLYLTPKGNEMYQYIQEINSRWVNQALEDLDTDERMAFSLTIERISEKAKKIETK